MKVKKRVKISVWQLLALAYLAGTVLGSILLILPCATKDGQSTSYLDALFTAASAVCITGLVPFDTATHWTLFGQLVILTLIQASGLGFMTLVSALFLIFKHGMGLGSRNAFLMDSRGNMKGLSTLLKRIVAGTFICEGLGALLMMIRFIPDFGAANGIYFSVWHSVSAFCIAGFDLMGSHENGLFVSLAAYARDPLISLTVTCLIYLGGLGFCVWGDVIDCKFNVRKFQLNTKVVLLVNTVLLICGTALFVLFERNNPAYNDFNFGELVLASLFNSMTPRTAGFSNADYTLFSESGYILTVLLMFIGGGSGSTAGGIRVGTFTVIIMGMLAVFRGHRDINIGKKRIDYSLLSQALAILAACLMFIMISATAICAFQPEVTFKAVLFECVSALSNTGLSLSLTPDLAIPSKIIVIFLMYAGRVGILTLALALGEKKSTAEIRKPIDSLLIG